LPTETTIRRINLNERLAEEIREIGVDCEVIESRSLPIEHKSYYSYIFPMRSKFITNRGYIRAKGKFMQIIQRN
jgi:hypothetical protein